MNENELKQLCSQAIEITYKVIDDAYGTNPEKYEAQDRIEAFKIILKKVLDELMK